MKMANMLMLMNTPLSSSLCSIHLGEDTRITQATVPRDDEPHSPHPHPPPVPTLKQICETRTWDRVFIDVKRSWWDADKREDVWEERA